MATRKEWEAALERAGHKCIVCGLTEKKLGSLDKAHVKARTKGGSQVVPMCPNCHQRFDRKLFNQRECKKVGITYVDYVKGVYAPRKSRAKKDDGWSLW